MGVVCELRRTVWTFRGVVLNDVGKGCFGGLWLWSWKCPRVDGFLTRGPQRCILDAAALDFTEAESRGRVYVGSSGRSS